MTTRWIDTPIGGLRLHAQSGLLTAIDFDARPRGERVADSVLDDAERQLTEYFAGTRTDFDLPLASEGTEFQKKVWAELGRIPYGETVTYGDIARRLGYEPVISRAVGVANAVGHYGVVAVPGDYVAYVVDPSAGHAPGFAGATVSD